MREERQKEKEGPIQRWTSICSSDVPIQFFYQDFENIFFRSPPAQEEQKLEQAETSSLVDEIDKDKNLWGGKQQKDTQAYMIELMLQDRQRLAPLIEEFNKTRSTQIQFELPFEEKYFVIYKG